jgi:hypothetical protein
MRLGQTGDVWWKSAVFYCADVETFQDSDGDGAVLRALHGPAGAYLMATGVRQHGDTRWLGSLTERGIARTSLSG